MKKNRCQNTFRYLCLIFVFGTGFLTILASSGGGGSDWFDGLDLPPVSLNIVDAFSFTPVTNAPLNTMITSDEVIVKGFSSPKDIIISGGAYSINGGPFTSQDGKIQPNSRLRVRILSAPTFDTERSASVKVGETIYGLFADARWSTFSVATVPGSASEAPTVQILSPFDQQQVNAQTIQVTGQASDPDGVYSIEVNGIAATSVDNFATWQARIPLETGPNVITIASADSFLNRNPTAAQIQIENLGVVLIDPSAIEIDVSNLRLLVADQELQALIAIDLIDGASSIISDLQTPDERVPLNDPRRLLVNGDGTIAWIIDSAYDDLIRVDLVTGQRSLIEDTVGTEPAEPVGDAIDIAIDESGGRALLIFSDHKSGSDATVVALDLLSGERTVLSDATTPNSENGFVSWLSSIVLDPINDRLLVFQHQDPVIAVDPITGQRSVVIETSTAINDPTDAELDRFNKQVLIVDTFTRCILALDLRNDELTTLWDGLPFANSPIQIEIDPYNDRLLLLYTNKNMLDAIDLVTGEFSIAF